MDNLEQLQKMLKLVSGLLTNIEQDSKKIKLLLQRIQDGSYNSEIDESELKEISSGLLNYNVQDEGKVVEGVYDGLYMIGSDDKKYPVPLNYSSKSKLISQDILKLTILANGKLIYKLIQPAGRTYIKATLSQTNSEYMAIGDNGKTYKLNPAAVSYFGLYVGDDMSIIINAEGKGEFAAIEAKL